MLVRRVKCSKLHPNPEEKALAFPFRNLYPERLRRGIPALFHFLTEQGYDIWVYSSNYYSMEYISALFRKYHVHVAGIVTGAGRKSIIKETELKELRGHISQKYRVTLHIDRSLVLKTENRYGISLHVDDETVICSWGKHYGFNTFQLEAEDADWKDKIIRRAEKIREISQRRTSL